MSTSQVSHSSLSLRQRERYADVERQGLVLGADRECARRATSISQDSERQLEGAINDWENEGSTAVGMPPPSRPHLLRTRRIPAVRGDRLPAIIITGSCETGLAVQSMKAGAFDFIEKPVGRAALLASIGGALEQSHHAGKSSGVQEAASRRIAALTLAHGQGGIG